MTVLDPSALKKLVADTESRTFVLGLVETFQGMLDARVARLVEAVLASDVDEALDAALGLKVSAAMTGTRELAELAWLVESDLRDQDLPSARAQALLVPAAAQRAAEALADYVLGTSNDLGATA